MFDHDDVFRQIRLGFELPPADSLEEVSEEVFALHVTKNTSSLDRLGRLPNLRYLSAHDIRQAQFRQICSAPQITHLGANTFGIADFDALRNLVNLKGMELTDNTKVTSLNGLEALTELQVLALVNCPINVDLGPISAAKDLRYLWLSSRYQKPMVVSSLSPLSSLTRLERLKLTNVRVEDQRLTPLLKLENLVELELPTFFPREEFVALAESLPNAKGHWLGRIGARASL